MSVERFDLILNAEKFVWACPISEFPSVLPVLLYVGTNLWEHVGIRESIMGGLFSSLSPLSRLISVLVSLNADMSRDPAKFNGLSSCDYSLD